jgi:lactoylglutathione lyase
MPYLVSHIHVKSADPKSTADWYVKAFNFTILSDEVRIWGDRFIRCKPEATEVLVMFSEARTGEKLNPGSAEAHFGLEHFGIDTPDLVADLKRLTALGAVVAEGPIEAPGGNLLAFIKTPGDVRIELIQRAPAKR